MPKEVAEAIETLENAEITTFGIICSLAYEIWGHSEHASEAHKVLRKFSFGNSGGNTDVLLKALVNDYEVEMTPEEKVQQRFNHLKNDGKRQQMDDILFVLNAYGIKVEGVNA